MNNFTKNYIVSFFMQMTEQQEFLSMVKQAFRTYKEFGSRSCKKTDIIHNWIKKYLDYYFYEPYYECKVECNINYYNCSGKKKCDVVLFKNGKPFIIFPIKFACSNFLQNRNNYWENLVGEASLLKLANPEIKIVPINIFLTKYPYFKKNGEGPVKYEIFDKKKMLDIYCYKPGISIDHFLNFIINNDECYNDESKFKIDMFDRLSDLIKLKIETNNNITHVKD